MVWTYVLKVKVMVIGSDSVCWWRLRELDRVDTQGKWDCDKKDMKSFGMFCEGDQGKDDWRVRIKSENQGNSWKTAIKTVYI